MIYRKHLIMSALYIYMFRYVYFIIHLVLILPGDYKSMVSSVTPIKFASFLGVREQN